MMKNVEHQVVAKHYNTPSGVVMRHIHRFLLQDLLIPSPLYLYPYGGKPHEFFFRLFDTRRCSSFPLPCSFDLPLSLSLSLLKYFDGNSPLTLSLPVYHRTRFLCRLPARVGVISIQLTMLDRV